MKKLTLNKWSVGLIVFFTMIVVYFLKPEAFHDIAGWVRGTVVDILSVLNITIGG